LQSPESLKRVGEAARERMASWSPPQNRDALIMALEQALRLKAGDSGRR
jgi:hypothetical protein